MLELNAHALQAIDQLRRFATGPFELAQGDGAKRSPELGIALEEIIHPSDAVLGQSPIDLFGEAEDRLSLPHRLLHVHSDALLARGHATVIRAEVEAGVELP